MFRFYAVIRRESLVVKVYEGGRQWLSVAFDRGAADETGGEVCELYRALPVMPGDEGRGGEGQVDKQALRTLRDLLNKMQLD